MKKTLQILQTKKDFLNEAISLTLVAAIIIAVMENAIK